MKKELTVEDIKNGYYFNKEKNQYVCNFCGKVFDEGEIFAFENRFFESYKAVEVHVNKNHGKVLNDLLDKDKKYTGLTDKQKELLKLIHNGFSDKEISEILGISSSTVRHQRFSFREKAKQAKMYLAIYELVNEKNKGNDFIEAHEGAKMVDDRYMTTTKEEEKILESVFESFKPLKLKVFSSKEKKKIVILSRIVEEFEKGKIYKENEVNEVLKSIFYDYVTLRRYLIEYGFMERTKDCKEYWRR